MYTVSIHLLGVRPLSFPNFSQSSFDILTWNLINEFVLPKYRSHWTFVTLDLLLHEIFPLLKFSFPNVPLLPFQILTWNLIQKCIWIMSWLNTGKVRLLLRLTLSYCPLQKFNFPDFSAIFWDTYTNSIFEMWIFLDVIYVKFDFCCVWPTFTCVIALFKNLVFLTFLYFFVILTWNLLYEFVLI